MVKLIQASLAIWGLFGTDREDLELDGLFCNETKEGISRWRQSMGMHEQLEVSLVSAKDENEADLGTERDNGRMYRPKDAGGSSQLNHFHHLRIEGDDFTCAKGPF